MNKKKALLVGINKYNDSSNNLRGCINDVKLMYELLTNDFGFNPDDIRVLTDERATKGEILARLNWLVSDNKPGDTMVFHFSGHGSQIRDREGDELLDYMDEIIVTYDHDWDHPLKDDDISEYLKKVSKGAYFLMVCDSCHSGTMTRGGVMEYGSNGDVTWEDPKPKYIMPPFDIYVRGSGRNIPISHMGRFDYYEEGQNHILISGCNDNETSADALIGHDYYGALTFNFVHSVKELRKERGYDFSVLDVHAKTVSRIKSQRFPQNPQLSGDEFLLRKRFLDITKSL